MSKSVLYVVANENFQDEEFFESKKTLESKGYSIKLASSIIGEAHGKLGSTVNTELLFSEVSTDDFDAIVFVGGVGSIKLWDDWRTQGLAKLFLDNGKIVAGIGSGVVIMANAGILTNINVTCLKENESPVRHNNANIVEENVVVSGNIITANGPQSAKEFGNVLLNALEAV